MKMRSVMFVTALGLIGAVGCKKDEPAPTAASGSAAAAAASSGVRASAAPAAKPPGSAAVVDTAKPAATQAESAPPSGGPFAHGEIFKHVPAAANCSEMQGYLDLAKLAKSEGLAPLIGKIDQKIAESMKGEKGEHMEKVLEGLKKAGIEPLKDTKEVAICVSRDGVEKVTATFGGDFAGKDLIGTLVKVSAASGGTAGLELGEEAGFKYAHAGKGFFGQVAPNVFVMSSTKQGLLDVRNATDHTAEWPVADKLFWGKAVKAQGTFDLAEKGDGFDFHATQTGEAVKQAASPEFKKAMKDQLDKVAAKLAATPFKAFAEDLRSFKFEIVGDHVAYSAHIATAHLVSAMKLFTEATEAELEKHAETLPGDDHATPASTGVAHPAPAETHAPH